MVNDRDPGAKGMTDGFNRWSPVDAMTGDRSVYGVMDMAGNVAEWTATVEHRGRADFPVVCGGSFSSQDFSVTHRVKELADLQFNVRTVSDVPPPSSK